MQFTALYPDQQELVLAIRQKIREGHRNILVVLPTGGGKTVVSTYLAYQVASRGQALTFNVHRKELIKQTSRTFSDFRLKHGIIAPKYTMSDDLIQIASVFTLGNRLNQVAYPSVIIDDECHHAVAGTWLKISNHYDKAINIGVTATPERLDGKGLGDIYTCIVVGKTTRELIDLGRLSKFIHYALPVDSDFTTLKKRGNDYDTEQQASILSEKKVILGDAAQHYKDYSDGGQGVAFCPNIASSHETAEYFRAVGIPAAAIDSKDDENREEALRDFHAGKLKYIMNHDIISEGFDIKSLECVSMLYKSNSLVRYLQQGGRALRVDKNWPEKIAKIFDHVGMVFEHGMIDEDRDWSLEGKKERKKKEKDGNDLVVRQCPECYAVHEPLPVCPFCGHKYESKPTEYERVKGVLQPIDHSLVDEQRQKDARRKIIASAGSYEELLVLQKEFGYKSGWAKIRWSHHRNNKHKRG